jgi:hypothetical protein
MQLLSNQIQNINDSADEGINYNAVTWPNDQYSKAPLATTGTYSSGDGPAVAVRMSSSALTLYRLVANHVGASNVFLTKYLAGVFSALTSVTQAWTDGDIWEIRVQGSVITGFRNGLPVSGLTFTDATIAAGNAGLSYSSEGTGQVSTIGAWEGGAADDGVLPNSKPVSQYNDRRAGWASGWRR